MNRFTFFTVTMALCFALTSFSSVQNNKAKVVWTQVVQMDAEQAFSTSESKGLVIFRLTSDMKLSYKYIVNKIDEGDEIMNGHIHLGAAGVEGGAILIGLMEGVKDLRDFKTIPLTLDQYNTLLNMEQPLYVNVHTKFYPGDSIRGQIR